MPRSRGFTLIEFLVVIAIIGILSSVVLASLNGARKKGRDARRISDLKQIELALEMYYDLNSSEYPDAASSLASTYISTLPADPQGGAYLYDKRRVRSPAASARAMCLVPHSRMMRTAPFPATSTAPSEASTALIRRGLPPTACGRSLKARGPVQARQERRPRHLQTNSAGWR